MADYCSQEQVGVMLGLTFKVTGSTPTIAQVEDIITDVTAELDFAMKSQGITVQPTDPAILGKLTIGCKYGAACQVGFSAFGNNTSVEDSQPNFYCRSYTALLKDIRTNPQDYGAVTGDATLFISNQVLDGTISETEQNAEYIPVDFEA